MIELSHVYKTYPGPMHALRDVHLRIEKGEFVFLTGPSGAGKTTLFRMISAYERPTSGNLQVAGQSLAGLRGDAVAFFRRRLGVVYQDFRLLGDRNVHDNVALPLEIRGEPPAVVEKKVRDLLNEVGLGHKRNAYPQQLSGGEQQRVAIARALVHQPAVLIADEPTGNLDPQRSQEIISLLDRANAQGTTVFVATHDWELVKRYQRRVVTIQSGVVNA